MQPGVDGSQGMSICEYRTGNMFGLAFKVRAGE